MQVASPSPAAEAFMKFAREYFEEQGTDISGMDDEELEEAAEVFELPQGRFLIVES